MSAADTLDALTSSRPYHKVRSLNDAIEILIDSSGYDYAPNVVKGMVSWVDNVRKQMGKSQLTVKNLLDSQKQIDSNFMSPLVACEAGH